MKNLSFIPFIFQNIDDLNHDGLCIQEYITLCLLINKSLILTFELLSVFINDVA